MVKVYLQMDNEIKDLIPEIKKKMKEEHPGTNPTTKDAIQNAIAFYHSYLYIDTTHLKINPWK